MQAKIKKLFFISIGLVGVGLMGLTALYFIKKNHLEALCQSSQDRKVCLQHALLAGDQKYLQALCDSGDESICYYVHDPVARLEALFQY